MKEQKRRERRPMDKPEPKPESQTKHDKGKRIGQSMQNPYALTTSVSMPYRTRKAFTLRLIMAADMATNYPLADTLEKMHESKPLTAISDHNFLQLVMHWNKQRSRTLFLMAESACDISPFPQRSHCAHAGRSNATMTVREVRYILHGHKLLKASS